MKKLILIALCLPFIANAKVIAESYNKGGGKIVLTDEVCRDGQFKLAYSQLNNSPTILGCWGVDDSFVHIRWYDDDLRSYPINNWRILKPTT